MTIIKKYSILFAGLVFLFPIILSAQAPQYSKEEIIGKWVLKSASFNDKKVQFTSNDHPVIFDFSIEGIVTFVAMDGQEQKGMFLIKNNKIIDPNVPEQPRADILSISKSGLVIEMEEEGGKVVMTFELDQE